MPPSPPTDPATGRLEAALAERGFADPRPALRERLRVLRELDPNAFEQAKARFESVVRDGLAAGDVLDPWVDYGRYLGELTGAGILYHIDDEGRGAPYEPPLASGAMLLHLPDDVATPALAVVLPVAPTAAQRATFDLLVGKKLALG
jgi:hypothetical protein